MRCGIGMLDCLGRAIRSILGTQPDVQPFERLSTSNLNDAAHWTLTRYTAIDSAQASPIGGVMEQVTHSTTGTGFANCFIDPAGTAVPGIYMEGRRVTVSAYFKYVDSPYVWLGFGINGFNADFTREVYTDAAALFNLQTGEEVPIDEPIFVYYYNEAPAVYEELTVEDEARLPLNRQTSIEAVGDGVYRCSVSFNMLFLDTMPDGYIGAMTQWYESALIGMRTVTGAFTNATVGQKFLIDGVQIERGPLTAYAG